MPLQNNYFKAGEASHADGTTSVNAAAFWRVVAPAVVLMLLSAGAHAAYTIDTTTFVKLSPVCKAFYVNASRKGKTEGMNLAGVSNNWAGLFDSLGAARPWMNHYCPALVNLVRLQTSYYGIIDATERRRKIRGIIDGLNYQLRNTRKWDHRNAWFKAEVYCNLGRAHKLGKQKARAEEMFVQSIETFPAYVPAYWELSELLAEHQRFEEAQATLETALTHVREKKQSEVISRKIAVYGKKSAKLTDTAVTELAAEQQ